MAASSRSALLRWILLLTASGAQSLDQPFKVTEGSSVVLACQYSVRRHGLSHVCWGRDCGTFWCNDILVQTDDNGVMSKISDRYRLIGDIFSGQMDLGIQKIQQIDSGSYCCRVDIDGLFNDKKVSYTLRVLKAPATTTALTTTHSTEPPTTPTGGLYRKALMGECLSSKEPPHIIYEMRTRRPVAENIYTLD